MSITFNSCLSEVKAKLLEVSVDPHRYTLESKKKLLLEAKECQALLNENYESNSLHLRSLIVLGVLALIFIGYTIYKKYQRNIKEYIGIIIGNNINSVNTNTLNNVHAEKIEAQSRLPRRSGRLRRLDN